MLFSNLVEKSSAYFVPHVLYMVATPLGNLADITARAVAGFSCADIIFAEDTRITSRLLNAYGIRAKLVSLREHNESAMAQKVCQWLSKNSIVLYVSDAGTPGVSDPGARLADSVWQAGFQVTSVPGACALSAAWSVSGVDSSQFLFAGFLPIKNRHRYLEKCKHINHAIVCYEGPHRICRLLLDIIDVLGESRNIILLREMTKVFETVLRMPAGDLLKNIQADKNQQKGEMTLIICPSNQEEVYESNETYAILKMLTEHLPTKLAIQLTSQITNHPKRKLYNFALTLPKIKKTPKEHLT